MAISCIRYRLWIRWKMSRGCQKIDSPFLCGYTKSCVISFIDIYKKVERNFRGVREVSKKDRITLGKAFIKIAGKSGMTIRPCAEGDELTLYGADCSGCMTVNTFETALHVHLDVPKRKTNQRNGQYAWGCYS